MNIVLLYSMLVGGTVLGAFASYKFKGASALVSGINLSSAALLLRNYGFLLGVVLYLIAAVNNIFLLKYLDYSIILPMSSITYIWTMIIAFKFLGETITKRKIFGVILVIIGAILLGSG